MIPKIIHYCWFGRNPLPESAKKCIDSWRKFLPDYEIKEWNEDNFDVNIIPYTQQAYEAKKYAFVSDYARFWILYHHGGVYFDTDVEVIRPMDDIIEKGPFMGREKGAFIKDICDNTITVQGDAGLGVAPGLGLGVNPGLGLYKEFLDLYDSLKFKNEDGTLNTKTIVSYTTEILLNHGLNENNDAPQEVAGVWVYPPDVFCPMDHTQANKIKITERTVSIHLYDCSWINHNTLRYKIHLVKNMLARRLGVKFINGCINLICFRKSLNPQLHSSFVGSTSGMELRI